MRLTMLSGLALFAGAVSAQLSQPGADPTRPPGFVAGEIPGAGEATGAVLQSVLIPQKGRAVAVISGQRVRVGEPYGERRLVRVTEREAVLDGPGGVERLQLTPGIEKIQKHSKETMREATKDARNRSAGVQHGGKP